MRAALINSLAGNGDGHSGSYGSIAHANIWHLIAKYTLDMLLVNLMVWDEPTRQFVKDPVACAPETREFVLGHGVQFGFCRAYNWGPQDEVWYAKQLHADLNMYGLDNKRHPAADPCYVMANAEKHEFDYLKFIAAYRANRPTRATGWAIEGFQGGRLGAFKDKINADANMTVFGEAYTGSMYPQAQDAVYRDLAGAGIQRVKIVYPAKTGAPERMDGCLYVLEDLPL